MHCLIRCIVSYITFQYLDTVTYLYGKRPTVPKKSPLHVHASKMYYFKLSFNYFDYIAGSL